MARTILQRERRDSAAKAMDIIWIKGQVENGNYQIKLHAVERASIRGIDPFEVKEALLHGAIIEDYPKDKRGYSPSTIFRTYGVPILL